jgi:hypothetical protein
MVLPGFAVILTEGVSVELTCMVTGVAVTLGGLAQEAVEVITTLTVLLLLRVLLLKVLPVAPATLLPLICHW